MADDEYIEVPAVVRMPKGERLADSRRTEGWSVGFTPKTSEKGPEHVEIRLTGKREASADESDEPDVVYIHDYAEPHKTREEEEAEELLRALVILGLIKAAEWAQPHLRRLLTERVLPFLALKREQWQARVERRRAKGARRDEAIEVGHAHGVSAAGTALSVYEADMTSDEARRHLVELMIAEHFVNEKRRLLANARIADDVPPEVADTVKALTPGQVQTALESILASRPNVLDEMGQLLQARSDLSPLQLGSAALSEARRLIDDR